MDGEQAQHSCRGASSFADVLRSLSVSAADVLFRAADAHGSVAAARLACKALRNTLDGSVQHVSVTLRQEHATSFAQHGQLPPSLTRWPRCTWVTINVDHDGPESDDSDDQDDAVLDSFVLLLPFMGLPQADARRIVDLAVKAPPGALRDADAAVLQLASKLPCLSSLVVRLLGCMSYGPVKMRMLHTALAGLAHLTQVVLPSCRALEHAAPLAHSRTLRELHVSLDLDQANAADVAYTQAAAAAVAACTQVQVMYFTRLNAYKNFPEEPHSGLHVLLHSLPPRLQRLRVEVLDVEMPAMDDELVIDFAAVLRDGQIIALELQNSSDIEFSMLAEALLSSRVLAPQLAQLQVTELQPSRLSPGSPESEAAAVSTRALLQRTDNWHVGVLTCTLGLHTAESITQMLQVLEFSLHRIEMMNNRQHGRQCMFFLERDSSSSSNGSSSSSSSGTSELASCDSAAAAATSGAGLVLPTFEELACAAVQRMAAAGLAGNGDSYSITPNSTLLLLTGEHFKALFAANLGSVQALCSHMMVSLNASASGVRACQAVPAAGCFVLETRSEAEGDALMRRLQAAYGAQLRVAHCAQRSVMRGQDVAFATLASWINKEVKHIVQRPLFRGSVLEREQCLRWVLDVLAAIDETPLEFHYWL